MKKILCLFCLLLGLLITANAWADMVSYDLGIGNAAIEGYPAPYAEVTVNLTTGTTATITFTGLTALYDSTTLQYLLGTNGAVAVNVNASSWTLGTITGSNAGTGFTPGGWSDAGAAEEDGFGSFNQTIDSFDGFGHSSDVISFVLTNEEGTWADAAQVLTDNADGYLAAGHIFVTSSPADKNNTVLATGYAANGMKVPEPSTLLLLGAGLLGVGFVRRRFKK